MVCPHVSSTGSGFALKCFSLATVYTKWDAVRNPCINFDFVLHRFGGYWTSQCCFCSRFEHVHVLFLFPDGHIVDIKPLS